MQTSGDLSERFLSKSSVQIEYKSHVPNMDDQYLKTGLGLYVSRY